MKKGLKMVKTKKRMRSIVAMGAMMILVCWLTACQPLASADNGNADEQKSSIPPETVQTSFSVFDGKLNVTVDAEVEMPSASVFPIAAFSPAYFTEEQMDVIVRVLLDDAPMYLKTNQMTKNELETELKRLEQAYENKKNGIDDPSYAWSLESFEDIIGSLKAQIQTAPDTIEKKWIDSDYYFNNSHIVSAQADIGREDIANLRIVAWNLDFSIGGRYYELGSTEVEQLNLTTTKQQAVDQAKDIVRQLGVDYMQPAAVIRAVRGGTELELLSSVDEAYAVIFTRVYQGIPITYKGDVASFIDRDDDINAEQIRVFVNDQGIVGVTWTGNGTMQDNVTDNATMMPFEELMQCFQRELAVQYSSLKTINNMVKTETLQINRIALGYMETQKDGDPKDIVLTPVWSFYGTRNTELDEDRARKQWRSAGFTAGEIESMLQSHREDNPKDEGYDAFITLSAIDGNVISGRMAY